MSPVNIISALTSIFFRDIIMKRAAILILAITITFLQGCGGSSGDERAVPTPPAQNDDGSVVTGILTAQFDPSNGILPFPINLLFLGTDDLTLNPPVADPDDFSDPSAVLSALDGFSTVAPWSANFTNAAGQPATLDASSVVPGASVRVFEVSTVPGTIAVSGLVRELVPGQDYVAVAPGGGSIAILPLQPLDQLTDYMAVITDGVQDASGNDATPSQTYFLAKRTSPLVDASGNSTDPLLPNATAQALEPLRQITNSQEAAAAAAGIDPASIVLSWTVRTQSITPVTSLLRTTVQAMPATIAPTGLNTGAVVPGSPGIADLFIGVVTLPYYLGVPTADNPTAPLNQFWRAEPGAYVPDFQGLGLNPDSTFVTFANPFPVVRDMQTVPVLLSVPNAGSGRTRPDTGWPIVIYYHGITRNRSDMLAIADTMAAQGFAVIAIDQPLHGITPQDTALAPLYVENTPFGPIANERTFDADYVDNATGAPGPDGMVDSSGTHFINLQSLLTSRDNGRQAQTDLSVLAVTIPTLSIDGDMIPDFDSANINFVGQSLGAMQGTVFLAVEPTVSNGVLNVPGGGIAQLLNGSETFGPRIRAGLAAAGVEPGTADFNAFLVVAQTAVDSADPINWGAITAETNTILGQEVIGDTVIPNAVPGAPLSGTEPLFAVMQLDAIDETTAGAMLTVATRFSAPGANHGSLLDPTGSPAVTAEMQGEMASMVVSGGTTVVVGNPSVLVPAGQ